MDSPQIEKVVAFGGRIYNCLNEYDNGNKDAFNVIIDQLSDPLLDFKVLMKLLKEIESCAPLITKDHGKIFQTLLSRAFDDFPDLVLDSWIRSVLSVITSQPVHLRLALSTMVMCFKYVPKIGDSMTEDEINELHHKRILKNQTVHKILYTVLDKIPLAQAALMETLEEKVPSKVGQIEAHKFYTDNLLKIAERLPISRPTILRIIFEHLCAIDHLLPNSFLLEAANQRDAKKSSNDNDDEEEDDDEEKIVLDPDKLLLLESLDHICCDVIDFIERITVADTKEETNANLVQVLRYSMSSFEQIFLPQPSTKCVQFIFFHLLSLKFSFPDSFIDWLFKRIVSPSEPVLKRQAAAGYLCGLCARAEYISKTTIREVVKLLSNFCIKYLLSIPEHKQNNDQQKFLPFYFVAQSLFYLIIFRWETIGIENLRDLNLQTIVFSKLNPLAELVPAVAIKFCDVMKETEILFGHVIIEQTRKERLMIRGANDEINPIDFYFPFDQCLLPNLNQRIESFYNYWHQDDNDDSSDESVDSSSSESEMEE